VLLLGCSLPPRCLVLRASCCVCWLLFGWLVLWCLLWLLLLPAVNCTAVGCCFLLWLLCCWLSLGAVVGVAFLLASLLFGGAGGGVGCWGWLRCFSLLVLACAAAVVLACCLLVVRVSGW